MRARARCRGVRVREYYSRFTPGARVASCSKARAEVKRSEKEGRKVKEEEVAEEEEVAVEVWEEEKDRRRVGERAG